MGSRVTSIGRSGGLRAADVTPLYGAADWLAKRGRLHGEREAIVEGDKRFTYAQLDERATRLANALRDRFGVRRGDRVATLTVNCAEFVEVYFATARVGAMLVPLNWRLAGPELVYQIGDAGAGLIFVGPEHSRLAATLRTAATLVPFGDEYEALLLVSGAAPVPADAQALFADPHLILYTSGTTGHPKGAVLTHANVFWNCANMAHPVGITPFDTTIALLPMFHSGGIGLWLVPTLYLGGRVVIARSFDPEAVLEIVARYRVAAIFGVPAIWLELLKRPAFDATHLPSLRFCVSGGAPHPMVVIEGVAQRGFAFLQGYGLTETAPGGTLMPVEDWRRKAGTAGKPAMHVELRVVDEGGRDCLADQTGEVLFRGPNVFVGYWNRPDATAEAFTPEGWFKTGDLGRLDDEGFLTLIDRKKDMVITGGENVYSAEVEDVLFSHEAVAEAAIIGAPDPKWGESVLAIVVLRPGAKATADELIAHCRSRLAKYKAPKRVAFVDLLPRNAAGKVLKRELRERFGGG